MRRWRPLAIAMAAGAAVALALTALTPFLAPNLSYEIKDRALEILSGRRGHTYRIALGSANGSYYKLGTTLNEYLHAKSGYRLEPLVTGGTPENVRELMAPARDVHLATIDSSSDEAARADGLVALAAIEHPYFVVMVPMDSAAKDIRDLRGPVNPGVRAPDQSPTLGETVLAYYGLIPPPESAGSAGLVSVVRPTSRGLIQDFDAKHMVAATRTQFLYEGLTDQVLSTGRYRLLPIPNHEALARAIPGAEAGFIPAGAYGPDRRIPAEPVPTIVLTSLLVARADLPGRVVTDVLEALYDPRFGRDIHHELSEAEGQKTGHLRLHPAADIYYHRNDLPTSDRLGRLSFVASAVAGAIATGQFFLVLRRNERRKARRALLLKELEHLRAIRVDIEAAASRNDAQALIARADDLLCAAERDAADDRLDADGIATIRSMHALCWRTLHQRTGGVAVRDDAMTCE